MTGHLGTISEENHPLAVWRDVRKPVIEIIGEDLLLLASVGFHSPDLHTAGALGVEINIFTVRRIFGTIVEAFGGREPCLFSAGRRNRIDIEVSLTLANERQRFTVGRPAVPIRWRLLRDAARRAAGDGNDVDQ